MDQGNQFDQLVQLSENENDCYNSLVLAAGYGWNDMYSVSVLELCHEAIAGADVMFVHEYVHVSSNSSALIDNEGT